MLAGRAFQGVGSGVILSLVEIVVSDLVPLSDRSVILYSTQRNISDMLTVIRGTFQGAFGFIWALASAVGA